MTPLQSSGQSAVACCVILTFFATVALGLRFAAKIKIKKFGEEDILIVLAFAAFIAYIAVLLRCQPPNLPEPKIVS